MTTMTTDAYNAIVHADPLTGAVPVTRQPVEIDPRFAHDSDLAKVDPFQLQQLMLFVQTYGSGETFARSLDLAKVTWPDVRLACKQSQTFKAMYDDADDTRRQMMCRKIEERQMMLATGEAEVDKAKYAPSTSAAQLLLQANDSRYKSGSQMPATAVAIQINI